MEKLLATLVNGRRVTTLWRPLSADRTRQTKAIILGGGTAGAIAAVTAAEEKLDAVLIEPHGFLGGVGTGGAINSYYHGTKGGVQDRIDAETHRRDRAISLATQGFHPEAKKAALDAALAGSSVEVRYRTRLTGVILAGSRVAGVRVAALGVEQDLLAPVTVDCSGDADVAALAGAAFQMGRPLDGLPQPYSAPCGSLYKNKWISHRNFDAGYAIPTDGADLSRALIAGHRQHLRTDHALENRMTYLAPHLGLREGRFIVGDATVTLRDLIDTRRRDDTVFETRAHYDNHAKDWAFESDEARLWVAVCGFWSCPLKADVPYGALLPTGVEGLLVACRGIALTHDSAQSFRMQRDMQKLGEVAARAAALAVRGDCTPRAVPIAALQAALLHSGCLETPVEPGRGARRDTPYNTDPAAIEAHLKSTVPGPGLWCATQVCNAGIETHLTRWLTAADANLAAHAALALGLRGNLAAAAALIRLVETRDGFTATSGHYTQPRWYAAMYVLEKLRPAAAAPALAAVFGDAATDPRALGFALRALLAIGSEHLATRATIVRCIAARLLASGFQPTLELQVSTSGTANIEPLRAMFDLTAAEALVAWQEPAGAELLEKYTHATAARERQFAAEILKRREAATAAAPAVVAVGA